MTHLAIRAPNWVGDLVMATPVLEAALREERLDQVSIGVRAHLAGVLAGGPCEERVVPLSNRAEDARWLRTSGADEVLLLTNSFGAAWRAFRAGIPIRAGAALGGRRLLLTHRVVPPARDGRRAPIPTAHLLRDVAGLLGVHTPDLKPRLAFDDGLASRSAEILRTAGLEPGEPYALCAPGAAFGAAKLWPPESHAAVLDELHLRHGLRGVVTGGPGEEPTMQAVVAACRHPAVSLGDAQRDLELLKPLVAGSALLLVGDSGPRWYAAAFDVPCVTVMGPNFPELTASSLEWCEVVRLPDLECAPCLRRTCPLEHHRCMRDLAPERALAAAEGLLARRAPVEAAASS
jgi:heptosyltransferase-2